MIFLTITFSNINVSSVIDFLALNNSIDINVTLLYDLNFEN